MGGLGVIASTQKPFVKFLIKAWPLALVAGWAAYVRVRHRLKQNELNTFNVLTDMGFILTPLVGLAMLNKIAEDNEMMAKLAAGQASSQTPQQSPVQQLMTAMQSSGPANAVTPQYDTSDSSMPPAPQMPASSGPSPDQGGTTPNVQGFAGMGSHLGPPTDPNSMWG